MFRAREPGFPQRRGVTRVLPNVTADRRTACFARATLSELRRDTDTRAKSLELREKEWDMAARVRERALADTREQVNMLLKELANATAELRSSKVQITDLQSQIEDYLKQLSTVIARAVLRNRAPPASKPNAQPAYFRLHPLRSPTRMAGSWPQSG